MINDITSIKTGQIWNAGGGATFKDSIDAKVSLDGVKLLTNLTGELLLIRMKDGVTAVLKDICTTAELECSKCLETFKKKINVLEAEAHFYEEGNHVDVDDFDIYFIKTRDMSIDLTEALRQEIILHFPMIPVCSDGCRGLCPECKVNLNHKEHKKGCKEPKVEKVDEANSETNKPFANLKDIMQN